MLHQAISSCRRFANIFPRGLLPALLVLGLAACSGGGDSSSSTPTPPPPADYSALQAKLKSFVDNGTVKGLAFVLETADGTLFTYSDGNLTTDSVIAIASSSKAPAVAAILALVDAGKLNLDTPVSNYLSAAITWPSDKAAITLRMLLNHTSGLAYLDSPNQPLCLGNTNLTTLKQCVQNIANSNLESTPGTQFGYGGSDYQVAGYIATLISGQSWQDFFDQRITQPLSMSSFDFSFVAGHQPSNPRIAGGGNTSATDYARFLRAVLSGGKSTSGAQVLPASFVDLYGQSQIAGLPIFYSPAGSSLPGYSYGWFISVPSLHPGSDGPEISDQGAFGATPWVDFDVGYGGVLFISSNLANGTTIWNAIRPLVLQTFGRS